MKKIVFSAISILFFSIALNAQQTKEDALKDTKAIEAVDKLVTKMKSFSTIKIDFTYKMENKEAKINQSKKGNIIVKGSKYKMDISGQKIFCDGKTIWLYMPDAEEVNINAVDEKSDDNIMNPFKMLDNYKANYKPALVREATENGVQKQIIDLYPKKTKGFIKIRLCIDKAKSQIIYVEISQKNGTTYYYMVDKLTPNVAADDSDFVFDTKKYPNVDVNDMR